MKQRARRRCTMAKQEGSPRIVLGRTVRRNLLRWCGTRIKPFDLEYEITMKLLNDFDRLMPERMSVFRTFPKFNITRSTLDGDRLCLEFDVT